MGIVDSFKNLTEAIKTIKDIFPKKSVSFDYAYMTKLAVEFAGAEVNDEIINRTNKKMKIDYEKISKLFKERYEFHIKNQIEMYKIKNQ
jgi:hypothetical protein